MRPSKYKPEFANQAYKLALLHATDKEIADFFEVTEQTLNNWKKDHPGFFESLKEGKRKADADVADSLYQRAMGFTHESEEIKVIDGEVVRVPVTKQYPPDTAAAIYWMNNRTRRSANPWSNKIEHEVEGIDLGAVLDAALKRANGGTVAD